MKITFEWIRNVYPSVNLTVKYLHRKSSKEAIELINFIFRRGGTNIHHYGHPVFPIKNAVMVCCGSQLMCELTFIVELRIKY